MSVVVTTVNFIKNHELTDRQSLARYYPYRSSWYHNLINGFKISDHAKENFNFLKTFLVHFEMAQQDVQLELIDLREILENTSKTNNLLCY